METYQLCFILRFDGIRTSRQTNKLFNNRIYNKYNSVLFEIKSKHSSYSQHHHKFNLFRHCCVKLCWCYFGFSSQ